MKALFSKKALALLLAVIFASAAFSACRGFEDTSADPVEIEAPDGSAAPGESDTPAPGEPTSAPAQEAVIDGLVINELMADNSDFTLGCFDDWAELYNGSEESVSLEGYRLVKDEPGGKAYSLDGLTVPADGYAVIMLGEAAPFRLSKDGGSLLLMRGSETVDELRYDASIGERAWSRGGACERPTPGFPNTNEGYEAYIASLTPPAVRINEVVSSNSKYAPVDGEYYDFVEVYNGSGSAVQLGDYYLSDKKSEPHRFRFPQAELAPGGYYIVYCSGKAIEGHAPFKISSSGETIILSDATGIVDCVRVPADLNRDESYGRTGGGFAYMSTVTPGAQNAEGHSDSPRAPEASAAAGAYDEPFAVELYGSGEIHFTLDGTEPGASSPLYTQPIPVEHITTIRAVSIVDGRSSDESSFFYLVNVHHAYPVLNVAIRQDYLTGETGVLNHVDPEYEHEAFVTMMDGGEELFSVPCGFKLHGNDSKKGAKQNFQLRFRSKYGMSKLKYRVFEDRDIDTFNSLLLKGGSEDYAFCNFRDELCTTLVDGTTALSTQAYRPVILYLDGEYWGIYWLRERIDSEYCAQRMGVSADSVNLLKDYGGMLVSGSGKGFSDLTEYCRTHDLTEKSAYEHVLSCIDHMSLIDWYVCRSYFGDSDLANQRFYSSSEADGKWHWCFFDLDWGLFTNTEDPIGNTARDDGNHVIFLALIRNPEFRDMFLKRYAQLLSTVLNERAIIAKADEFIDILLPEIEADRARYGITMREWEFYLEQLKDFVRDGNRNKTVLKGIKNYFGLSEGQMKEYFGGAGWN